MNLNPVRFGTALKVDFTEKSENKMDAFSAAFFGACNAGELRSKLDYDVLSLAGIEHQLVRAYDPGSKALNEYLLIDTPQSQTLTQAKALEKELRANSAKGNDDYDAYDSRINIALSFLLPMKGLIKADAETLTVEHSGGVISEIVNKEAITTKLKQLINPNR